MARRKRNSKRFGLDDFARTINTERKAVDYFIRHFYPDGKLTCPFCNHNERINYLKSPKKKVIFKCYNCRKKFTVKKGTFLRRSKIPMKKWLPAIWLDTNSKKGISAHQLSREINVSPNTALEMLKRIREGYKTADLPLLTGMVAADEGIFGGYAEYRHYNVRQKANGQVHDPNFINKVIVAGVIEQRRGGQLRLQVIPDKSAEALTAFMLKHVDTNSVVKTDSWQGYNNLKYHYKNHLSIDHNKYEYVNKEDNSLTTNAIERIWSLLRKFICGQCNNYCKKYVEHYLAIFQYRVNTAHLSDKERFNRYIPYLKCNNPDFRLKDLKKAPPIPYSPVFHNQINSEGNDLPFLKNFYPFLTIFAFICR